MTGHGALRGLAWAALVLALCMPLPVHAAEPLPACRIDDVMTRYPAPDDWYRVMLDTTYRLPDTFEPDDLVSTADAGLNAGPNGTFRVRAIVIDDLRAMAAAARAAGTPVAINSAYRSYVEQKRSFELFVKQAGYAKAVKYGARPGHSEHQLGTTIDLRSAHRRTPPWGYPDWSETPAGSWVKANAWRYGFVMSYPRYKRTRTCMGYEPWHYRYLGRAAAAAIHDRGITSRRYLWETFDQTP